MRSSLSTGTSAALLTAKAWQVMYERAVCWPQSGAYRRRKREAQGNEWHWTQSVRDLRSNVSVASLPFERKQWQNAFSAPSPTSPSFFSPSSLIWNDSICHLSSLMAGNWFPVATQPSRSFGGVFFHSIRYGWNSTRRPRMSSLYHSVSLTGLLCVFFCSTSARRLIKV